jgi:hypothetical protein
MLYRTDGAPEGISSLILDNRGFARVGFFLHRTTQLLPNLISGDACSVQLSYERTETKRR